MLYTIARRNGFIPPAKPLRRDDTMHLNHALWLGLPLLLLALFVLTRAWLPGRPGALLLAAIIIVLVVIFVMRFRKTFRD